MFVADSLVQKVPLRSSTTPATRLGTLPEMALVLVAAGGLGWSVASASRGRRDRRVQAVRPEAAGAAEPTR
jgi:apolipoprotein N-acyltransferase